MCVCAQLYMDQTKKIFDHFICIWKCFSSLSVSRFCTYFAFQCFKLVFVLKNRGQSLSWVVHNLAGGHKVEKCIFGHQAMSFASNLQVGYLAKFPAISRNSQIGYFMGISWVLVQNSSYDSIMTSSSPNPLFQSFYIKTQLISIVLHSINISKVIFNTSNWFWSLDYVLGSFIFIVGTFSNGDWKV